MEVLFTLIPVGILDGGLVRLQALQQGHELVGIGIAPVHVFAVYGRWEREYLSGTGSITT